MRNILSGIALFCFLIFVRGAKTVQAAVTDVSDHFVSLKIDNKKAWFNDDFVHVQAKFSDKKQSFTAGSMMKITWKNSRDAFIQGIDENKKLVIQDEEGKSHEVGQYVVDKDGVVVLFNDKVEDFRDANGQIDFDLQVKNKSEKSQDLLVEAGDLTKSLHVVGQRTPNKDIGLVTIDGSYDREQNNISWAINIKPDKAEYAQFEVNNAIPEGLILDEKSLKVKIAGQEVKLDKDNFQINGNNLKLNLDTKKYQGEPISISYNTLVKDPNALNALNQVAVRYMVKDGETINENVYGGKVQSELDTIIFGKAIELKTDKEKDTQIQKEDRNKTKDLIDRLNALLTEKNKQDKQNSEPKQTKDLQITTPTSGLTGFDAKPTATTVSVPKAKVDKDIDDDLKTITDKTLSSDDLSLKEKGNTHHRSSGLKLPKAGEATSIVLSIVGGFILIIGGFICSIKMKRG
ncbi:LPXTG cell wall anchor domain-containing protein [uncultured Lactobacillus sp.]|uniref:LPXTG cell wall anchor domain-containing protein n=1 Tax=uncultured Lactobacillus sp. TaxID=153152 RepID=UPI0028042BDA|nr:LPXTG cell wall anchor domain-containing protein [uncultured Lactobacillus sp.]